MAKSTKAILTDIVPLVNTAASKNGLKIKQNIGKFINDRNQYIFDTCPCDRIYYGEEDAQKMFDAVGVSKDVIHEKLKGTYFFPMAAFNPRAAKDELTGFKTVNGMNRCTTVETSTTSTEWWMVSKP